MLVNEEMHLVKWESLLVNADPRANSSRHLRLGSGRRASARAEAWGELDDYFHVNAEKFLVKQRDHLVNEEWHLVKPESLLVNANPRANSGFHLRLSLERMASA